MLQVFYTCKSLFSYLQQVCWITFFFPRLAQLVPQDDLGVYLGPTYPWT